MDISKREFVNIINAIKVRLSKLHVKTRTARQDNDRIVSTATTRALRCIAHERFNEYNSLLSHHRRFNAHANEADELFH
jgi:hypothetical protein